MVSIIDLLFPTPLFESVIAICSDVYCPTSRFTYVTSIQCAVCGLLLSICSTYIHKYMDTYLCKF